MVDYLWYILVKTSHGYQDNRIRLPSPPPTLPVRFPGEKKKNIR